MFRLYYASDVHGSGLCWRKFLNASSFYAVDALIMGGDLTGKLLAPVIQSGGAYNVSFRGEEHVLRTPDELDEFLSSVRLNGFYPWITSPSELARFREDPILRDEIFESVMAQELEEWVRLADARLSDKNVKAYVIPGNDDPWSIDPILKAGESLIFCDDTVVTMGTHELLSCAWSNRTPWNSPRELDEDVLYGRLRDLAECLESPQSAIFNIHPPPFGTELDMAAELDATLRPITRSGQPHLIPVGSTAVREIIEEYQPLLSLHGHIHESRGIAQVGRTVAINSGSEYNSGRIHGCIVELEGVAVKTRQLVSG